MSLPKLIEALLDPGSYPEPPGPVEVRQTHISYILLTPKYAYKIKKPVNFGFLDFTTLDKRLYFCNEEVKLNRRLAFDVYIGVAAITIKDGRPFMGGEGKAIEYAVKMRRLNEDMMLDSMLRKDAATAAVIGRVARVIAGFHEKAGTSVYISGFGRSGAISRNTDENFAQTKDFIGKTITQERYDEIKEYARTFLKGNKKILTERVRNGFIKDCHGDIHCDHVSVEDGINIIDCVEFNERFRYSDTIADIVFLSMDLDFRNRTDLSRVLDAEYLESSGDRAGQGLMDFYKCYRAFVRGKVEGFKCLEAEVTEGERMYARLNARRHFHLAGQYATGGIRPVMVIVRGLSGSGKTAISHALSEATSLVHLSSDSVRKDLAGIPQGERRPEGFKEGIYSDEFTERTYDTLIEKGISMIKAGRSVILDATFSRAKYVDKALKDPRSAGKAEVHLVECGAEDKIVRERLLKRSLGKDITGAAVSDAGWEIYIEQKKHFEALKEPYLALKPEASIDENVAAIVNKIFG